MYTCCGCSNLSSLCFRDAPRRVGEGSHHLRKCLARSHLSLGQFLHLLTWHLQKGIALETVPDMCDETLSGSRQDKIQVSSPACGRALALWIACCWSEKSPFHCTAWTEAKQDKYNKNHSYRYTCMKICWEILVQIEGTSCKYIIIYYVGTWVYW